MQPFSVDTFFCSFRQNVPQVFKREVKETFEVKCKVKNWLSSGIFRFLKPPLILKSCSLLNSDYNDISAIN